MNLKFFEDINPNDLVGGKGASLAKMSVEIYVHT